jgi:hypothetical protein
VHQRVIRTVKFTLDGVAPAEQFLVDLQEATQGESVLPETEPNDVVPAVGGVPDAEGRTEKPRIEAPGAAENDTVTTAAGCPSRAIQGRSKVVVVPRVFRPFPHIAMNLVEPPRIGLE